MRKSDDKSIEEIFTGDTFKKSSIIVVRLLLKGFGFGETIDSQLLWNACIKWARKPLLGMRYIYYVQTKVK